MKTVLNSAKFLFKSLNHSCYCKEVAMFTCAKEMVTSVIKNTYRHCNQLLEASRYLGDLPSHM